LPSGEGGSVFAPPVRLPVFAGRHRLLYALASLVTPKSLPALWGPTFRHSSHKPMCILETHALGSTLCKLGRAVPLATYLTLLFRYVGNQLLVARLIPFIRRAKTGAQGSRQASGECPVLRRVCRYTRRRGLTFEQINMLWIGKRGVPRAQNITHMLHSVMRCQSTDNDAQRVCDPTTDEAERKRSVRVNRV